jgi:hypothetical protein
MPRELRDWERRGLASLYVANREPVPRHLLPDADDNVWRRYEREKELIPPCSAEEYERRRAEIAERLGV